MTDLGPPWVLFSDKGRPIAILPAGRPGEVANVEGLPLAKVQAIIEAANGEALNRKLDQLIGAMRGAIQRLDDSTLARDALDLLEGHEWGFEDRGGEGEWNVCLTCWAEYPIGAKDKPHKPDCQWVSVVERLRKLISG